LAAPGERGMDRFFERQARRWLEEADIEVGGSRPWDIQVHDNRLWRRAILGGSLGFGEAYMDGWFDAPAMDELLVRLMKPAGIRDKLWILKTSRSFQAINNSILNRQSKLRATKVARTHYDAGNNFFEILLDKLMIYSCGYWCSGASDLASAQIAKLNLIAAKLELKPGMKVLDIGCGWGGSAYHLAQTYGVQVVGVTISEEQVKLGLQRNSGLDVEIRLQDYRDVNETFDAIYSIGMFEHVGAKNYDTYFETVKAALKPQGRFLLHTIGHREKGPYLDPWFNRYIFPNGYLPSASELAAAAEKVFVIEDWHNFGPDYDKTLMCWLQNLGDRYSELDPGRYDERFRRMFVFYLAASAAGFRLRLNQLWQVLLSHGDRTDIPVWR
jgi:cyclopropane-fatty-acyl-phospholipid synthase